MHPPSDGRLLRSLLMLRKVCQQHVKELLQACYIVNLFSMA